MDRLRLDLRHAVRSLSRSPGFTLATVVTLALGIGATTAVFSVVDAVLLQPFGLPDEGRLVTVWQDESARGGPLAEWTGRSVFGAWRDGARGFDALSARMTFPSARFPERQKAADFVAAVLGRLEAQTDVVSAGAVSVMPLSGSQHDVSFAIEGRIPEPGREPVTDYRVATPGYFRTLGIPLVRGRLFEASDDGAATKVALINEELARRHFPGEDPLGRRLRIGDTRNDDSPWWTVVGIVGSVRDNALDRAPDAEAYVPASQRASRTMTVVVRSERPPETLVEPLRAAIWSVDPEQAVSGFVPARDLVRSSLARTRFLAGLLGAFALLALVLAVVGVYGVMAYSVSRRTREIGVRMALGARPRHVLALVLRQGAVLAVLGLVLGLFMAYTLTASLGSLLFGVSPHDPATFAGVVVVLASATLAASALPARRAARVDPVVALEEE